MAKGMVSVRKIPEFLSSLNGSYVAQVIRGNVNEPKALLRWNVDFDQDYFC